MKEWLVLIVYQHIYYYQCLTGPQSFWSYLQQPHKTALHFKQTIIHTHTLILIYMLLCIYTCMCVCSYTLQLGYPHTHSHCNIFFFKPQVDRFSVNFLSQMNLVKIVIFLENKSRRENYWEKKDDKPKKYKEIFLKSLNKLISWFQSASINLCKFELFVTAFIQLAMLDWWVMKNNDSY